jgi:centrosomal protein CEP164
MSAGEVYFADDGTVSMVLDSKIDPNYEPTQQELDEYATWLGIDPVRERELMFLAREGLKAPLPEDWKPCKTDTGDVYYFNFSSGESIWEHPLDDHFKKRLEEERDKLRRGLPVGPSADEKKKKDKKKPAADDKPAKLVKGAAGNQPSAMASPLGASKSNEFAPLAKTGRLGGLRPDVSDLVPETASSNIPRAFALPSSTPASQKEPGFDEEKFKESLRAEHDEQLRHLGSKHEESIREKEEEYRREISKLEKTLAEKTADEVDDAKRAADRRLKREYQLFEESIERQLEDLRRTLRNEKQRVEAEEAAVDARVEQELSAKRKVADATVESRASDYRSSTQAKLHADQATADIGLAKLLDELRRANHSTIDATERAERSRVEQRLEALDAELSAAEKATRAQLAQEREAAVREEQAQSSSHAGSASPEYTAAEQAYSRAVADAKAAAAAKAAALRQEFATKRHQAAEAHAAALVGARSTAASSDASVRTRVEQRLRADAEVRLADARQQLDNDRRSKEQAYLDTTDELVEAERAASLAKASASERQAAEEAQRLTRDHEAALREAQEAVRREHAAALASAQSSVTTAVRNAPAMDTTRLAAMQADWNAANPDPTPLATANAAGSKVGVESAIAAARTSQQRDHDAKLAQLRQQLQRDREAAVEAQRKRAATDMEARLVTYRTERRDRASRYASPVQASVVRLPATALSVESEQALADERARLQSRLDSLALELAGTQVPPRPESAASRDLPNLRASTSLRGASQPESPHRDGRGGFAGPEAPSHGPMGSSSRPASAGDENARRLRRIQKAKERIRAEKHSIRQRQTELEDARSEWRRDMRRAKERKDVKEQQVLHVAKGVLEERARVLNADTAALKASIDLVKEEERKAGVRSQESEGAAMYAMLKQIAEKVETVETRLKHNTSGAGSGAPPARARTPNTSGRRDEGGAARLESDRTREKWNAYMRPASSSGGRRHLDVETWLDETAF